MPGKSNTNCCVVGCQNTYANSSPGVRFYSFPNKPWEKERRKFWIQFTRRLNKDKSLWQPTTNSRICSTHFINNKKEDAVNHPSYNPTVFPDLYKKKQTRSTATDRFKRANERAKKKGKTVITMPLDNNTRCDNEHAVDIDVHDVMNTDIFDHLSNEQAVIGDNTFHKEIREFGTQTDEINYLCDVKLSLFISCISEDGSSAQVNHSYVKNVQSGISYKIPYFSGYNSIINNENGLTALCSVSLNVFALLVNILKQNINVKCNKLRLEDCILLFLMKLKLGISFNALGVLFDIHRSSASRIFFKYLHNIAFRTRHWIHWFPKHVIQHTMPVCFKEFYPNCRVIIDCTEMRTEIPPNVDQQNLMYSNYKGCHTVKYLVGITPNGQISFLSPGYGGRSTDGYITNDCGILAKLEKGDLVLADKGFPKIRWDIEQKDALLVMPPFATNECQFSVKQMEETYKVASVRIHVERIMQRLKIFNILNVKIPVELISHMDEVMHVCAVLVNFQPLIIQEPK